MPFHIVVDPAAEARAAREKLRAEEQEAWKKNGRADPVMRLGSDGVEREVPRHILEAEKADGVQRIFLKTLDRQGYPWANWTKPIPPKPARVLEAEKFFRVPWRWDPIEGVYIKDDAHQMPPAMRRVADMLEPDDPRQPVYNRERQVWTFPSILDDSVPQKPQAREDLVSEAGSRMDYWNDRTSGQRGMISHSMGDADIPDGAGSVYPAQGGDEKGGAA